MTGKSYRSARTSLLLASVILAVAAVGLLLYGSRSVAAQGNGAPAVQSGTNSPATGEVTICCGVTEVGDGSWPNTRNITDADGMTNAVFSYQWMHSENGVDTDIPGVTQGTYRIPLSDVGKYLRVRVNFRDDAGNEESITSSIVGPVKHERNAATNMVATAGDGSIRVTWDPPVNHEDAEAVGFYKVTWQGEGVPHGSTSGDISTSSYTITGLTNGVEVSVQVWTKYNSDGKYTQTIPGQKVTPRASGSATATPTPTATATATHTPTVTPTATVTPTVTATATATHTATVTATPTATWTPTTTPTATVTPEENSVPNNPATGTLTFVGHFDLGCGCWVNPAGISDADGMTDVTFNYQWMHTADGVDTEIPGATRQVYSPTLSDLGKYLKVRVSFTDDAGNPESITSGAVGPAQHKRNAATNVQVTVGDGSLRVTWDEPDNHEDAESPWYYRVNWWGEGIPPFSRASNLTERAYTISGLTNGVEVTVQVWTRYSDFYSAASVQRATPSESSQPVPTSTPTATPTATASPTATATATATHTATVTATPTATWTPTTTPTATLTPTVTATPQPDSTSTPTPTPTATATATSPRRRPRLSRQPPRRQRPGHLLLRRP